MPIQIEAWVADSCRLSLFAVGPLPSVEVVFEAVVGQAANSIASDRLTGQSSATGTWKAGLLQVVAFPGRLDFVYTPIAPAMPAVVFLEGSPSDRCEEIIQAVGVWAENSSSEFVRVAIGGRCFLSAPSVEGAYAKLAALVRTVKVDFPRMIEMQFRANFQTTSTAEAGLILNRISSWNSVTFQRGLFTASGISSPVEESYHCMCELDFNTDARRQEPLPKHKLRPLLNELKLEAVKTLTEGVQ
jgi:hypothetical protein